MPAGIVGRDVTATDERTSQVQQTAVTTPARPLAKSSRAVIGNDRTLRAAYRHCRQLTREQDRAEYALIQLVPAALRPACWALWAAANAIDDLADDRTVPRLSGPHGSSSGSPRWSAS